MCSPTPADLKVAIHVLAMLAERVNSRAEHYAVQFAEASTGAVDIGRIRLRAIEHTTRIEKVVAQLDQWRQEVSENADQELHHHE